jgi:heat shock protein HslJ
MKILFSLLIIISMFLLYACNNTKISSADSATASQAAAANAGDFTGKKWKLIELHGQPVADSINGKEPGIIFTKEDSSYAANGGCNGLGGKFEWNTQTMRIHFTQGMSTMMACEHMDIENGLKDVFANADNYSLNDTIFTLNKARMAPLARFKLSR